jgi:hypothetical protein
VCRQAYSLYCLAAPETKAGQRKEVLDKIYFNLGRPSEACCNALESIRG